MHWALVSCSHPQPPALILGRISSLPVIVLVSSAATLFLVHDARGVPIIAEHGGSQQSTAYAVADLTQALEPKSNPPGICARASHARAN
eukprot:16044488-Heterocapsa_arctica.AAC.1